MSILRRHPITSLFVLAYAITWAGIPFGWFFTFVEDATDHGDDAITAR